jgi:hypothetical protein
MNTPFYSLFNRNMAPSASTAFTITFATLANGACRQSTLIANGYGGENQYLPNGSGYTSVNMAVESHLARVYFSITMGTTPTTGGNVNFYLIQSDVGSPAIITDGCGASDAAYPSTAGYTANTPVNAPLLFSITVSATPSLVYKGSFIIPNPGPTWGIAVQNMTGVAFAAGTINYVMESTQSRF